MGALDLGFELGDCVVRPKDGTLVTPRGIRQIAVRPMALLLTLARQPGEVVGRDALMAEVWAGVVVSDETLSRCVSDLRQALGDDPRRPRYIQTLSKRGYRLLEAPRPLISGGSPPVPALPGQHGAGASRGGKGEAADPGATTGRMRRAGPYAIAAGLAVLGLAVLAGTAMLDRKQPVELLADSGLAVLPFANLSADADLEYFSDGLTEELLNTLAGIESLDVVARTSVFAFKGSNRDVREIGRELGVAHVLEGSVRREGDRLRIAVQLIDARNGFHRLSRIYERSAADVFDIQQELALEVSAALELELTQDETDELRRYATTSPEALEAFLLGQHLQRRHNLDGLERSAEHFREAIELDPGFARAMAGLAQTLALTSQYGEIPISRFRSEIEALAARALELDPGCAPAWHARGLLALYEGRPYQALDAFEAAMELDPNAVGSMTMLARVLHLENRNREALAITTRALRKDPVNLLVINNHASVLRQLSQIDEAERWLRRSMEIDAGYLNALWGMGYLKWVSGRPLEAASWYQRGIEQGIRQAHAYNELGWVLLDLGDYEGALRWMEQGLARAMDPVSMLDGRLAWHLYQGDVAGLAATVADYDRRYPGHRDMPAYRGLAALLGGDAKAALREYESLAGSDTPRLHSRSDMDFGGWHAPYLALARQLAGHGEAALHTLAEAEMQLAAYEREGGVPGHIGYYRAAIAALRGQRDTALDALEKARIAGWRRHAQARHDPLMAALRDDPRFDGLLARVQADLAGDKLARND